MSADVVGDLAEVFDVHSRDAGSVGERAGVGRQRVQVVGKIEGRRPQLNRLPLLNRGGPGESGVGRSRRRSPRPGRIRRRGCLKRRKQNRHVQGIVRRGNAAGSRRGTTRTSETESTQAHQAGLRTIARKRLTLRPGSGRSCGPEGVRTDFTHQKGRSGLSQSNAEGCRLPNRNRLLPHPRSYRRPRNPASQRRAARIRAQCRGPRPLRLRRQ